MTYKELVDDLIDIVDRHKMIQSFGYGPISSIPTPRNQDIPNYPYAFFNPSAHQMSKNATSFRFNLIVMEMCDDDIDSVVMAQSNCHQYIKDILAELYYNMEKYDFTLNSSLNVFTEKYDDTVSGMTASIQLEVRDTLDDCIAPFEPTV